MICILCLLVSSTALKLQQDPEFDITDMSYDEECGNRYNYKCWKKGGHSLDKHERAHFTRKSKEGVSFVFKYPNAAFDTDQGCTAGTKFDFPNSACGANYNQLVFVNADIVGGAAAATAKVVTVKVGFAGSDCSSTTVLPAAMATISRAGNTGMGTSCDSGTVDVAKFAMDTGVVSASATAATRRYQVEMRGNSLHAGETALVGKTSSAIKCYTLTCSDTAINCAKDAAASTLPTMSVYCDSNAVHVKYYSNAACASVSGGELNVGTKANNCYDLGTHYICPDDFTFPEGSSFCP